MNEDRKYIIAIDVGFNCTGLAAMYWDNAAGWLIETLISVRVGKDTKKKQLRVADSDADRLAQMARGIITFLKAHPFAGVVVELPSGGAQGARANRCMGAATGMIAAIMESLRMPCEWYSPNETRIAATGARSASKAEVIAGIQKQYPGCEYWFDKRAAPDIEAMADALATFTAAKNGNIVMAMEAECDKQSRI